MILRNTQGAYFFECENLTIFFWCWKEFLSILLYRDKVLCGLWTWNAAHGESFESYLWIVHRLCTEESLLWDGDAHSMWTIWHQPIPGYTEGSRYLVRAMNCPRSWISPNCFCFVLFCYLGLHLCNSKNTGFVLYELHLSDTCSAHYRQSM